MSKKSIANNYLNYTKKTTDLEREIKLINCKNETRTYFLVIDPKTKKIKEDGWIGKKSLKRDSNNSKSTRKQGGRKHKKTIKHKSGKYGKKGGKYGKKGGKYGKKGGKYGKKYKKTMKKRKHQQSRKR